MKKLAFVILAAITVAPLLSWGVKVKKKKSAVNNSPIVSVTMRRTTCFGRCPDYSIELNKDGTATYKGMRFVKDSGTFRKNIGTTKTMNIINQLIAYRADTCSNVYDNRIPDLPGIIYTINYKDSTKRIMNANFCPHYLTELAIDMDNIGKKTDKTWKMVKK